MEGWRGKLNPRTRRKGTDLKKERDKQNFSLGDREKYLLGKPAGRRITKAGAEGKTWGDERAPGSTRDFFPGM